MLRFRIVYYSLLFFVTALAVTSIAQAQSIHDGTIIVPNQNLAVVIDVDACDMSGHVLCGGTGSLTAAAVGNDSIAVVFVHARTANGQPVTGLTESDFSGVYRSSLRPVSGGWFYVTYIQVFEVSAGAITRRVVIPVTVPN